MQSTTTTDAKKAILKLAMSSGDTFSGISLNDLIISETYEIVKKHGTRFSVFPGKSKKKYPNGQCYANAVALVRDGFGYVEGYIINGNSSPIAHAWNVGIDGVHYDFTLGDSATEYEYFGIILPEKLLYEIGAQNGHIWFAALPFITSSDISTTTTPPHEQLTANYKAWEQMINTEARSRSAKISYKGTYADAVKACKKKFPYSPLTDYSKLK